MDIEKDIEKTVSELPNRPPDEVYETMEDYETLGGDALIYSVGWVKDVLTGLKHKAVKVTCTACGASYFLEYIPINSGCSYGCSSSYGFVLPDSNETMYHGQNCLCPKCGTGCEVAHVSRFRSFGSLYTISHGLCLTAHCVGKHLCLLSWRVYKCCDKEGNIKYRAEKYEGVMIVGGKPIRITGHARNTGGCDYEIEHWKARKRFSIEVNEFAINEIYPFDCEEIAKTDSANCAIDEFVKSGTFSDAKLFQYLKLWCKYPNVENLVRNGFSDFIDSLISLGETQGGYPYYTYGFDLRKVTKYVNWNEARPHLMLGIEKEEIPNIRNYSAVKVLLYAYARRVDKVKLSRELLDRLTEYNAKKCLEFLNEKFAGIEPKFLKTFNYIQKQQKKCKQKNLIDFQYLKDYWDALYKVYGTMDKELLYPGDLKVAHDRTIMLVKEKENEELSRKINKATEKYIDFSFEDKKTGLFITPCRTHSDLLKEGEILNHCVATYASSVAAGRTCIFFIRKISEPDIPFFTLELKENRVIQNRGYKNCDRTSEVIVFEKKWLKFIKGLNSSTEQARSPVSPAGSVGASVNAEVSTGHPRPLGK